jgi:hypothetical protein
MEKTNPYDVAHTIGLTTNRGHGCEHCDLGLLDIDADAVSISEAINHYIGHGYHLLHVGTETSHDDQGKPWHSTVALLGK